jgi:small subunit ribosomal protein S2
MKTITLEDLLQAGCHFGHKSERWHPKAHEFIYAEKDGIHIIDLAKTKHGLEEACRAVQSFVKEGKEVLFVGTKRQAKGVVKQAAESAGAPYLIERWIGGFLTNWDGIKQNIEKINRMQEEKNTNAWKKFPKHEQVKLAKYLERLKTTYAGVLTLKNYPDAIFVVDIRKEQAAIYEAQKVGIPIIAIVDTNTDPTPVTYVIPANDDAVGSIAYIVNTIGEAYKEAKEYREKHEDSIEDKVPKAKVREGRKDVA